MKDKLMVINKYKDLIDKYSKLSLIYPKKYYDLKDKLESSLFTNLRELYIINCLSNKEDRIKKKEELLGELKYLNYLFTYINKLNILSDKQYKIIYIDIEVIYKYLIGWINYDKNNR